VDDKIEKISEHTIKKFELLEKYVYEWAVKLLNYGECKTLIYIDCMCNNGEYIYGKEIILGSGPRIVKTLNELALKHLEKKIIIIFNDIDNDKIEHLKKLVYSNQKNVELKFYIKDANVLLQEIQGIIKKENTHYLLFYDPYQAKIDWRAIGPYLNRWGEVIINHMISDSIRAIKEVKSPEAKEKYENTYLKSIEQLIPYGSDRSSYENRINEIIKNLSSRKNCYIASFPIFNKNNSLMYDIVHITSNINGFKLFKKCAWQIFEGKSSNKKLYGKETQITMDFDSDEGMLKSYTDNYCYNISNIVDYLYQNFKYRGIVSKKVLWECLDNHPVFPSDSFKKDIIKELKDTYGIRVSKSTLDFGKEIIDEES